ncbi:MAG: prepilin-type N-terminal cleavage/methylation domain-containing protein [Burkholderiales bacterium]
MSPKRAGGPASAPRGRAVPARSCRGFTLIELLVALGLLALMSGVLFGSLRLAGRSADAGDAKAEASSGMRLAGEFLRTQLSAQHPQRMHKLQEFPLLFGGEREELRFAAPLPGRVGVGGMWYYRLVVAPVPGKREPALVLERVIPDLDALAMPAFTDPERSVLADDVREVEFSYYGRDRNAAPDATPTWRSRWDDAQQMPILVRVEVKPREGPPWPPLTVAPRTAPEAGCRSWDTVRRQCVGV